MTRSVALAVLGGVPRDGKLLDVGLPSLETNSKFAPKIDAWKTISFPFGASRSIFRGELLVLGRAVLKTPYKHIPV